MAALLHSPRDRRSWSLVLGVLAACSAPALDVGAPTRPVVFAPGVVTGPPAFSPDGNTVYFATQRAIVVSHRHGEAWSTPEVAAFSGHWRDADPAMSPDGSFLIFSSNRPASEPGAALDGEWGVPDRKIVPGQGGNLWRVNRAGDGWSAPVRLPDQINRCPSVFEPSIVADGSVYFMDAHLPGGFRFYRSQYRDGAYQAPEPLPFTDGTSSDWDLTVAPDEAFLVFASNRRPAIADHGDDLFIVQHTAGRWGAVTHLGPTVNDPDTGSIKPRLGPDHHTLYFLSDRAAPGLPPAADPAHPAFHLWRVDLAPLLPRR